MLAAKERFKKRRSLTGVNHLIGSIVSSVDDKTLKSDEEKLKPLLDIRRFSLSNIQREVTPDFNSTAQLIENHSTPLTQKIPVQLKNSVFTNEKLQTIVLTARRCKKVKKNSLNDVLNVSKIPSFSPQKRKKRRLTTEPASNFSSTCGRIKRDFNSFNQRDIY